MGRKKEKSPNKDEEAMNELDYLDDEDKMKKKMQDLKLEDTEKEKLAFKKFKKDPEMGPRYKVKKGFLFIYRRSKILRLIRVN